MGKHKITGVSLSRFHPNRCALVWVLGSHSQRAKFMRYAEKWIYFTGKNRKHQGEFWDKKNDCFYTMMRSVHDHVVEINGISTAHALAINNMLHSGNKNRQIPNAPMEAFTDKWIQYTTALNSDFFSSRKCFNIHEKNHILSHFCISVGESAVALLKGKYWNWCSHESAEAALTGLKGRIIPYKCTDDMDSISGHLLWEWILWYYMKT